MNKVLSALWRLLKGMPLKVFFALLATCILTGKEKGRWNLNGEEYPFSPFPMYSYFRMESYYLYLADKDGNSLPVEQLTNGRRTSHLKNIYKHHLGLQKKKLNKPFREFTAEDLKPAAIEVLKYINEHTPEHAKPNLDPHRPLQLYRVDIFLGKEEITSRPYLAASETEIIKEER